MEGKRLDDFDREIGVCPWKYETKLEEIAAQMLSFNGGGLQVCE